MPLSRGQRKLVGAIPRRARLHGHIHYLMSVAKLFTPARRHSPRNHAVVVCVERGGGAQDQVHDEDLEDLAARLRAIVMERQLGTYDGSDKFSSESRLYFFSAEADRLAAVAIEVISTLVWRDKVHVRVSLDPLGTEWRAVSR